MFQAQSLLQQKSSEIQILREQVKALNPKGNTYVDSTQLHIYTYINCTDCKDCICHSLILHCMIICMHIVDGEDNQTSPSLSETAELQQKIQDLHKLNLSQRQEIVQRDTQIEQLVSSVYQSVMNSSTVNMF